MTSNQPEPGRTAGLGEKCPHLQHAIKLRQHGDFEGARDTVLLAIDVDFNNADAWALLSGVYDDMEEPWHAQEAARQAIRSNPRRPDLRVLLGVRLLTDGKPDEALTEFDAAILIKPSSAGAHFNRGLALAALGREAEAVAALAHAVKIEPGLYGALEDLDAVESLRGLPGFPAQPEGYDADQEGEVG